MSHSDIFDDSPETSEEPQLRRSRAKKKKMTAGKWVISGLVLLVLLGIAAIGLSLIHI